MRTIILSIALWTSSLWFDCGTYDASSPNPATHAHGDVQ